ncbi:MAG: adenylyltransferase/cytidyltransferase family protein [Elusimicrobia bacterium]|nr:adenylyltransferase/cytidyltransferase family protein [Elusimicrobiota bacterium]
MSDARKVMTPAATRRRLQAWRRSGRRVVFTNGVFDLLHAGHVDLLERARALGDALIVGVNSDSSARRLEKGPGRPFNPLRDRMRVLAALASVDAVVPFSEDTPERLLSTLKPDVLVKGADYRPDQVAGRRHAGKVVLIRLNAGYSTTRLAGRIAAALSRR